MPDMRLQMNALPNAELEKVSDLIRQAKLEVNTITGVAFSNSTMEAVKTEKYQSTFVK